jgi:hypothetical protein
MAFNFEYFDADGTTVAQGVFIPQSDLLGIQASEFASAQSTQAKDSKLCYSIMDTFVAGAFTGILALDMVENLILGTSSLVSTKTFATSIQYFANIADDTAGILPKPVIGSNVGVVELAITDVFPNAVKLSAGASTGSAGVLVPSALLDLYGSGDHASIDPTQDSRDWMAGLIRYMADNADVRSDSVASAIVDASISDATGLALTDASFDATNPTTGLDSAKRSRISGLSLTASITIERIENRSTQTYDANVVTA